MKSVEMNFYKHYHNLQNSDLGFSGRKYNNPKSWAFYRALKHIFEEQDATQTRSQKQLVKIE